MRLFRVVKLIFKGLGNIVKDERRRCEERRAHDLYLLMRKEFENANKL